MDTKTESVRAITDEMRRAAGAETDPARLYGWADRLDQAQARREAEAAREASEAAARAFERGEESGTRASGAPMGLDEAIEHAEKRADETPCGRAHGQLAGWLRELRDKRTAAGNGAEIRAALEYVLRHVTVGWAYPDARKLILAALDAPPRNCDRPFRSVNEAIGAYVGERGDGPHLGYCDAIKWALAPAKGKESDRD